MAANEQENIHKASYRYNIALQEYTRAKCFHDFLRSNFYRDIYLANWINRPLGKIYKQFEGWD